ncbi:MAG: PfkB family carbohydrate kinase [Succinivibrio sp.]
MLDFSRFYNKRIKCAGLGEVLFDVYPSGPKIGGAPANFAYHCRQNGLEAVAISSVGHDSLGFLARDLLAQRFLPALLTDSDNQTGVVNISLSEDGVPTYTFEENTAYDDIRASAEVLEVAGELDMICFGSLAQRSEKSHAAIMDILDAMPEWSLKVFDVNLRAEYYSREIIEQSLARSQIFKCNEDELPVLCELANVRVRSADEYSRYLKDRGIDCFVFTEGALKSTVYLNDEKTVVKTPKLSSVVDTVGAGDSFTATLISSLMKGCTQSEAHTRAVNIAAYVCTQKGAMPDIPQSLLN